MKGFLNGSLIILFCLHSFSGNTQGPVDEAVKSKEISSSHVQSIPNYYSALELGLNKGTADLRKGNFENTAFYMSIAVVNPIRVYENFSAGPGIGFETYAYGAYMPVFLDLRYHFGNRNLMPMLIADIGYSFGWMKEGEGSEWAGLMLNPAIGFALKKNESIKYYLKLGYKIQDIKTPHSGFNEYRVDAGFYEIKFALVF